MLSNIWKNTILLFYKLFHWKSGTESYFWYGKFDDESIFFHKKVFYVFILVLQKSIGFWLFSVYRRIFVYIFPFISIWVPVSNKFTKTEALYIESAL